MRISYRERESKLNVVDRHFIVELLIIDLVKRNANGANVKSRDRFYIVTKEIL